MTSIINGFEQALYCLGQWHSRRIYNRWFAPLKICEKTTTSVVLTAPTSHMVEETSILFGTSLLAAFRTVWPEVGCVRIKPAATPPAAKKRPAPAQLCMELAA